jgi:hypothetical protein
LPKGVRVIHYWSEKIHSLNDESPGTEAVDSGVILPLESYDHIIISGNFEIAQNLGEVLRTDLASSP